MRLTAVLILTTLAACTDLEPVDTEPALLTRCSMCDDNGLHPVAWQQAPFVLAPAALGPTGLRLTSGAIAPLCDLSTVVVASTTGAVTCDLAPPWSSWAGADWRQGALVTYMIKVGARKMDTVTDPATGIPTRGAFGLAPTVLTTPWTHVTQSIVTAGMAAAVDYYANAVEICIRTETGSPCPPKYGYQEIAAAGNLFAGRREVVIGGYATEWPDDSRRVCPGAGSPCNSYSSVEPYHGASCAYTGPSTQRVPTSCADPAGGPAFDHPVQVFTEWNPLVLGGTSLGGPVL